MIRIVFAVLSLVLLAGCGVTTQDRPTRIDPSTVPFRLLESPTADTNATPTDPTGEATPAPESNIYFVDGHRLTGRYRELGDATPGGRLEDLVVSLSAGPDPTEQSEGLTTAAPPGLQMSIGERLGTTVTVELVGDIRNESTETQILLVGQIVLTVTSQEGVEEVLLSRDGDQMDAPLLDGSRTAQPLVADDYLPLVS